MGEGKRVIFEDASFGHQFNKIDDVCVMAEDDHQYSSSIGEDSCNSSSTCSSSSDLTDDASSSDSSSSNPSSIDLSDLMAQLPIKRGLSKFYHGKSQSYSSLSKVTCLEDLARKQNNNSPCYRKKMVLKSCKSYGGGLDSYKSHTSLVPKPTISKKTSSPKGSFGISRRPSFGSFCRPPLVPVQEKL